MSTAGICRMQGCDLSSDHESGYCKGHICDKCKVCGVNTKKHVAIVDYYEKSLNLCELCMPIILPPEVVPPSATCRAMKNKYRCTGEVSIDNFLCKKHDSLYRNGYISNINLWCILCGDPCSKESQIYCDIHIRMCSMENCKERVDHPCIDDYGNKSGICRRHYCEMCYAERVDTKIYSKSAVKKEHASFGKDEFNICQKCEEKIIQQLDDEKLPKTSYPVCPKCRKTMEVRKCVTIEDEFLFWSCRCNDDESLRGFWDGKSKKHLE